MVLHVTKKFAIMWLLLPSLFRRVLCFLGTVLVVVPTKDVMCAEHTAEVVWGTSSRHRVLQLVALLKAVTSARRRPA